MSAVDLRHPVGLQVDARIPRRHALESGLVPVRISRPGPAKEVALAHAALRMNLAQRSATASATPSCRPVRAADLEVGEQREPRGQARRSPTRGGGCRSGTSAVTPPVRRSAPRARPANRAAGRAGRMGRPFRRLGTIGWPVVLRDVRQVDERRDLLIVGLGSWHDEAVAAVVAVKRLIVTDGPGVLAPQLDLVEVQFGRLQVALDRIDEIEEHGQAVQVPQRYGIQDAGELAGGKMAVCPRIRRSSPWVAGNVAIALFEQQRSVAPRKPSMREKPSPQLVEVGVGNPHRGHPAGGSRASRLPQWGGVDAVCPPRGSPEGSGMVQSTSSLVGLAPIRPPPVAPARDSFSCIASGGSEPLGTAAPPATLETRRQCVTQDDDAGAGRGAHLHHGSDPSRG